MGLSDDDRRLLAAHAPQLRYHPNEPYRADSAGTMTDAFRPGRYSNELRDGDGGKLIAQARPTNGVARLSLATLVPSKQRYYPGGAEAEKGDYLVAHDQSLREDWMAARTRPGYADVVYCRIAKGKRRRWLQYWLFFYDNSFRSFGFGQHQGDWELIQLGMEGSAIKVASYSQHGECEPRNWKDVRTVGDAGVVPIVYVANGSHACYYDADRHVRIFGLANDHTADGGDMVRPRPYMLDDAVDRWIRWPGRWGREDSPQGPPHQLPWNQPDAFHAKKVKRGILAGLEAAPVPGEPAITATLTTDAVAVEYTVAPPAPGRSDPARLELALSGQAPGGRLSVPSVLAIDVTARRGRVDVPLPYAPGPYVLHVAVYDAADEELRLAPRTIDMPLRAGLEAIEPRVLHPEPSGPPPSGPAAVRIVAGAPRGDTADVARVRAALAQVDRFGARFVVAPLFESGHRELRRYLVITGTPNLPAGMDVAAATFEAARQLQAALPEGWDVQADPPSGVANPSAERPAGAGLADERAPDDWALTDMRVREAWAASAAAGRAAMGQGIVIGQPDTGYTDHPELEPDALDRLRDFDVLTGRDDAHAVLEGMPPAAFPSHGTATASVVVSREAGRITGSAPGARVVPIRAARSVIHFRNAELAVAVERAWSLGVDIISISMGGVLYPPALRAVIKRAVNDGVIVMAAAGQFVGFVVWPARFPECLGIGGAARGHRPWSFSSRGGEVDVSAPAKDVWVAATRNEGPDPYYVSQHDGTSFAVALTAGVAALWLAHHGGRDKVAEAVGGRRYVQAAFRALVRKHCATPRGWGGEGLGAGIVDAEKLLAANPAQWRKVETAAARLTVDRTAFALDAASALAPDGVDARDAKARTRALFGDDEARLGEHADEVVYRLAEHADVRAAVLGAPGAQLGETVSGRELLRAVSSPSLREALA